MPVLLGEGRGEAVRAHIARAWPTDLVRRPTYRQTAVVQSCLAVCPHAAHSDRVPMSSALHTRLVPSGSFYDDVMSPTSSSSSSSCNFFFEAPRSVLCAEWVNRVVECVLWIMLVQP